MKIAIIGTGMIGSSMAALFTGNGYDTTMLAVNDKLAEAGKKNWTDMYKVLEERKLVTPEQTKACEKNLHITLSYSDIADADIIMECAFEDKDVKCSIYKEIEANCNNYKAVISTSSAMSPDTLIDGMKKTPEKLLVAHPFNPPHLVPFVELVRSAKTSDEAAQAAYDFLESCGRKVCIMKKSAPGFIANRLQHALLREAIYMVEQGMADPRDIDKALMYSFMPRYTSVGLFEHQDAAGLDMVLNIEDYLLQDLSNADKAPDYIRDRVNAGDLGQKTGKGVYEWDEASKADFKVRAAEPYWKYFNWKLPEE
jgi:3-hydroxybutyryl-CoA dehydrogenase